jgi:hypothetical protein
MHKICGKGIFTVLWRHPLTSRLRLSPHCVDISAPCFACSSSRCSRSTSPISDRSRDCRSSDSRTCDRCSICNSSSTNLRYDNQINPQLHQTVCSMWHLRLSLQQLQRLLFCEIMSCSMLDHHQDSRGIHCLNIKGRKYNPLHRSSCSGSVWDPSLVLLLLRSSYFA